MRDFLPKNAVVMARRKSVAPEPAFSPPAPASGVSRVPADGLEQVARDLEGCTRCKLSQERRSIVLGEGNPQARLVFVGEGPGESEDQEGRPFAGKEGQLLDRMIEAMGLKRSEVFLASVVKCRVPSHRAPEEDEIAACSPYLLRQIEAIGPEIVVALGTFAAQALLGPDVVITQCRGQFQKGPHRFRVMPTYHPSYLLKYPESKREAWLDLQAVAKELGIQIPSPKKN